MRRSFELVADAAQILINSENFDDQINQVIEIIGTYADVSRVYVFIDNEDGTTTSNTHEWCNSGINPQINELQNIPYEIIPSWKLILINENRIFSEDIYAFPQDIIDILEPQGILSIVVYPLYINNQLKGFIGFDECNRQREWSEAELNLLKAVSALISSSFEHKSVLKSLKESERNFQQFFRTITDFLFIVSPESKIIHVNNAVVTRLGYTYEELTTMDLLALHPVDKHKDAIKYLEEMINGEREYCPLELETKSGTRLPVESRVWPGEWNGKPCIFGISKDLSSQQEALQKFTKLFENNPALMAISTIEDGTFVDVNEAFLKKLGYSKEEVIGKTSNQLNLFDKSQKQQNTAKKLQETGQIKDIELRVRCKDGSKLCGLFSGEIIDNQNKQYFLTVMVDITEQKILQEQLEINRQRLENIIEGTRLGTWEWNVQTGKTVFNDRWAEIIGYKLSELEPLSIDTWLSHGYPEDLVESEKRLNCHFDKKTNFYDFECRMKHKDGHWVWVHDRGKVIEWDEDVKPLMMFGTHSDITEKKEMESLIRESAIRDPLTGIYNRRYVFERIDALLGEYDRKGISFSVTIIDIDHFKHFNDTYGHLAGDFVLREFTQIITKNIRPYDILGRYGGEEFIIVSVHSGKVMAKKTIERILDIIGKHIFHYENAEFSITFSAGIAEIKEVKEIDEIDDSMESLIALSDKRLYKAKNEGRNKVLIS